MAEAGGTTTANYITNVGSYSLYEVINDSVDDGETITLSLTATPEVTTSSKIVIVGVYNETTENQITSCTASYAKSTRAFTFSEGSASDDVVRILFYVLQ